MLYSGLVLLWMKQNVTADRWYAHGMMIMDMWKRHDTDHGINARDTNYVRLQPLFEE